MKDPFRAEQLLADVLDESVPARFRDELMELTLRHVRRRRRMRKAAQGMAAATLLAACTWLFFRPAPPAETRQAAEPRSVEIVVSAPLPASMTVESNPDSVSIVRSLQNPVPILRSGPARPFLREVDDDELLRLLADYPVALVRRSASQAELLFLGSSGE